jgi:hypothetical protein
VLLAFALPLRLIVQLDRLLATPDTRDLATAWLLQQGPESPAVTQGWYAHVRLLEPESIDACRPVVPPFLWREVPLLPALPSNWKELVDAGEVGWGAIGHSAIDQFTHRVLPGRERARFVVDGEGTLPCGREGHNDEYPPLELPCYALVAEFDPGASACNGFMDVYDAMWIPYRGFEGQRHPGPRMRVYENYCKR